MKNKTKEIIPFIPSSEFLNNYWWHRLFKVLFYASFILLTSFTFWNFIGGNADKIYKQTGHLNIRFDSQLKHISSHVYSGEKIGLSEYEVSSNYTYSKNGGWLLDQPYFCANDVYKYVKEMSEESGVNYYKGDLNLVSEQEFVNYLRSVDAKCIQVLDMNNKNLYGSVNKALSWGLEAEGMKIFKESDIWYWINFAKLILIQVFIYGLIVIFYKKIFLYIVLGNQKKSKE